MAVFYILVIMLMRVVQSLYNKKACLALPDGMEAYIDYLTLSNVLAAAFAAALSEPKRSCDDFISSTVESSRTAIKTACTGDIGPL